MKADVGLHKRGNIWHYKKLVSVPEDSAIGLRSSVGVTWINIHFFLFSSVSSIEG